MTGYIKQMVSEISAKPQDGRSLFLLQGLAEEMAKLDARDFLPESRVDFVDLLGLVRRLSKGAGDPDNSHIIQERFPQLLTVLDAYGGAGSQAVSRDFRFVQDADLRIIVNRDYRELSQILFPDQAWKSTVIMAGSILEAILYDQLTFDSAIKVQAMAESSAPKYRDNNGVQQVKNIDDGKWDLIDYIRIAAKLNIIASERKDAIDQVLRDYRNFVHPKKEIKAKHQCREAEALMAKGNLDGICDDLEDKMPAPTP